VVKNQNIRIFQTVVGPISIFIENNEEAPEPNYRILEKMLPIWLIQRISSRDIWEEYASIVPYET
jgi:hypothetical protein